MIPLAQKPDQATRVPSDQLGTQFPDSKKTPPNRPPECNSGNPFSPEATGTRKDSNESKAKDETAGECRDSAPTKSGERVDGGGRERLKRHRAEVAGRVWIPDMWGQENLLKDWIDCTAFDASLVGSSIMSARAALMEEGRRKANSISACRVRVGNSC